MNKEAVRVGVIGAGFISAYHLNALQKAGADLIVVADPIEERARKRSAEFGVKHHTTDYRAALARDDVEAVVITVPDFVHAEVAIAALRAGKTVLLQKPMARTPGECQSIIDVAEETGTPLYVSFMHRHMDETVELQHLLVEGALGQVYYVDQINATPGPTWAAWYYRKENVGGGMVKQLGVHGIDLLRYLFGEIEAVKATVGQVCSERRLDDGSVVTQENDDIAVAVYRFRNGLIATQHMDFNEVAGTERFRTEVRGLKGVAHIRSARGDLAIYAPEYTGQSGWVTPDFEKTPFGVRQHSRFMAMVRGEEPPDGSARDGLASLIVAEAVYRSSESGAWEETCLP